MGTHADSSTTQTLHMYINMTKATNQQWLRERWRTHSKQVDVGKGEKSMWKWNGEKQETSSVVCVYIYVCVLYVCVCQKKENPN